MPFSRLLVIYRELVEGYIIMSVTVRLSPRYSCYINHIRHVPFELHAMPPLLVRNYA